MLIVDTVNYSIGNNQILKDISFEVKEKETIAILGASGSGKSTILKAILGLIQLDSGQIFIDKVDIQKVQYSELVNIRKKMGIVFQEGALFDSLTVGENVGYYYMEHDKLNHEEVEPRVLDILETVGLKHAIDMLPEELSGGMRRRVAIARALIYKPELILYDEPTTGLDPIATDNILDLINHLKHEHHVASIVVTHNLDDAAKVADHFIVIRSGAVVWQGKRRQFLNQRQHVLTHYFRSTAMLATGN